MLTSSLADASLHEAWPQRPGGLSADELVSLAARPAFDPASLHPEHPTGDFAVPWDSITDSDVSLGLAACAEGSVGRVVLAGGTGSDTLYEPMPGIGCSLLAWHAMLGAGIQGCWMVNPGEVARFDAHLADVVLPPTTQLRPFEQFSAPALLPDMTGIARRTDGGPLLLPCGHGDLGPAMAEAGLLDVMAVDHVVTCNADNPLASPDIGLIGLHLRSGADVTCELVEREDGDRGGMPAIVAGRLQLAEDWRLPSGFASGSQWFSTNTMVISARALGAALPWRWHRVLHNGVVQHVRLLQQLTEEFNVQYIASPRAERYASARSLGLDGVSRLLDGRRLRL